MVWCCPGCLTTPLPIDEDENGANRRSWRKTEEVGELEMWWSQKRGEQTELLIVNGPMRKVNDTDKKLSFYVNMLHAIPKAYSQGQQALGYLTYGSCGTVSECRTSSRRSRC